MTLTKSMASGIAIGVTTAIVAKSFGYEINQLEYWGFFVLMEIPYIVGYIIGRGSK